MSRRLVVIGAGMAAHRLVDSRVTRAEERITVTVLGDEARRPYDRVGLTRFFDGDSPEELTLAHTIFEDPRVTLHEADPAAWIDRAARTVTTASGAVHPYDHLVLATGSRPTTAPFPVAGPALLTSDYIFSLQEQYHPVIDRYPQLKNIEVRAGHVEIVDPREHPAAHRGHRRGHRKPGLPSRA